MERIAYVKVGNLTACLYEMESIDLSHVHEKLIPSDNRKQRAKRIERHPVLRGTYDPTDALWFGGVKNLAEGKAIFEQGWSQGAARVKALAEKLAAEIPPARSVRRKLHWSDSGDEVSKDRLNAGQVESCWRVSKREMANGPEVVTIETNWGANHQISAEQMFWQGAAAACLIDLLESAGYRVEVYAANYSRHDRGAMIVRVRIKEADQPARLDTIAAMLCHAASFRLFGITAIEQATFQIDKNYGKGTSLTREQFEALEVALGQNGTATLCFGQIYGEDSAVRAIEEEIARLQGDNQ